MRSRAEPKASDESLGMVPLSDAEFALFQRLVHGEAGIWLSGAKRALLSGRLSRRIRQLGLKSFRQYYRRIVDGDEAERARMLDRISTNETHFFREPQHFEFLNEVVLPQWLAQARAGARPSRLRVWCAGCSSGEEPYSIAMTVLAASPEFAGWDVEILGTDISTRMLEKAKSATWSIEKVKEIPPEFLRRFMLRGVGPKTGLMTAKPGVRRLIRIESLNLNHRPFRVMERQDLIFCRNVLIYFDHASKQGVVEGLLERLAPGGLLFVGHSENLHLTSSLVRTVSPTIYTHCEAEQAARRT